MKYFILCRITPILLLLFCIFLGCSSSKNSSGSLTEFESQPKILFLNYNIKKTIDGKKEIELINKKITDGTVKKDLFEPIQNGVKGDLIFTELNKREKIINQVLIKNPLVKNFEYVDDSKHFKTKVVNLNEIQFSIRLQLKIQTKHITISNFAENKNLIKTKIN